MKILSALAAVFAVIPLWAEITIDPASVPIKQVYQSSDIVCAGRVENVVIQGSQIVAHASILDIYKGSTSSGAIAIVTDQSSSMPRLVAGETALLFLNPMSKGGFRIAENTTSITQFTSVPRLSAAPTLDKLESVLVQIVLGRQASDTLSGLERLQQFDKLSAEHEAAVRSLTNSSDDRIGFRAIAVLLKTGTVDSVTTLTQRLAKYNSNEMLDSFDSIGSELAKVRSTRAVPDLGTLSGSRFFPIQFGAMEALRSIGDPAAASTLIRRLDDPNRNIQGLAVIALAETFHRTGDYFPSLYSFDKKPDYFVNLWKKWWQDEGRLRYGTPKS